MAARHGSNDGERDMSDLKVDYAALEDSVQTLSQLKSEFDGIEGRTDDTGDIWGHDAVKSAMDEFSGNMDYNRRKLTEEIEATGAKMQNTLETFRDVDAKLAESFDKERTA
jgi:uncharacterized protein YukE